MFVREQVPAVFYIVLGPLIGPIITTYFSILWLRRPLADFIHTILLLPPTTHPVYIQAAAAPSPRAGPARAVLPSVL